MDDARNPHTVLTQSIIEAIGRRPECRVWLNNIGAARSGNGGFVRFGLPGSPDIIGFLRDGRFLGIEIKTGTGRLTPRQEKFHAVAKKYGCVIILARSVQDAVDALDMAVKDFPKSEAKNVVAPTT